MELAAFFSYVFTLTLVMDPLGNLPLFVSTLKNVPDNRKSKVVLRELIIALFLMLFFLFFGKYIVSSLSLDLAAMAVGGGIVLFIIGLQMIFPTGHSLGTGSDVPDGEPFIVPLAIPLVAGPSVLTTVLLFSLQHKGKILEWTGVILVSWLINALILGVFSVKASKWLGQRGLLAIEKLMGMILITISTQMVMDGLKQFLGK